MADDVDPTGHDPAITNYFLDVLSSGLGAAVLLFMIFAVLPHYGESGAQKAQGETAADSAADLGGPEGAVNELDQLAGKSVVTFFVEVKSLGGKTLTPNAWSWGGVKVKPGEIDIVPEVNVTDPSVVRVRVMCRKGISPSSKVVFTLTDKEFCKAPFQVKAEAVVGVAQRKVVRFDPTPDKGGLKRTITVPANLPSQPPELGLGGSDSVAVVQFNLANKGDWIVFP